MLGRTSLKKLTGVSKVFIRQNHQQKVAAMRQRAIDNAEYALRCRGVPIDETLPFKISNPEGYFAKTAVSMLVANMISIVIIFFQLHKQGRNI